MNASRNIPLRRDIVRREARIAAGWFPMAATLFVLLSRITLQPVGIGQSVNLTELASIKGLKCVFPMAAVGNWSAEGLQPPRIKTEGILRLDIDSIDTQDGSAHIEGTSRSAFVVARLSAWSLHFLETDETGGLNVTTVFAQHSQTGKLRAVHSRASYIPVELPGVTIDPSASQYYGECDASR
jgi:hypothetical protein